MTPIYQLKSVIKVHDLMYHVSYELLEQRLGEPLTERVYISQQDHSDSNHMWVIPYTRGRIFDNESLEEECYQILTKLYVCLDSFL